MKRFLLIILTLMLLCTAAMAAEVTQNGDQWYIAEADMTLTITEGDYFFYRGMPADSDALSVYGISQADLEENLEANNAYIDVFPADETWELRVTCVDNDISDMRDYSDYLFSQMVDYMVSGYADYGAEVTSTDSFETDQAKWLVLEYRPSDSSNVSSTIQFYTLIDHHAVNITLCIYASELSDIQRNMAKAVADSAVFGSNAEREEEKGGHTEAFTVTDPDSGLTYTIPADWKETEFTIEKEFLQKKYVPVSEDGACIMFGAADAWMSMSESDRQGLSRKDMDISALTEEDLKDWLEDDVTVSRETYGSQVWLISYSVLIDAEDEDLELKAGQWSAITVKNGWVYNFQYGGFEDEHYEEFLDVLRSVTIENSETAAGEAASEDTSEEPETEQAAQSSEDQASSAGHTGSGTALIPVLLIVIAAALLIIITVLVILHRRR